MVHNSWKMVPLQWQTKNWMQRVENSEPLQLFYFTFWSANFQNNWRNGHASLRLKNEYFGANSTIAFICFRSIEIFQSLLSSPFQGINLFCNGLSMAIPHGRKTCNSIFIEPFVVSKADTSLWTSQIRYGSLYQSALLGVVSATTKCHLDWLDPFFGAVWKLLYCVPQFYQMCYNLRGPLAAPLCFHHRSG